MCVWGGGGGQEGRKKRGMEREGSGVTKGKGKHGQ